MLQATIYFDPKIHKALKMKAIQTENTLSELVNEAVKMSLSEDLIDLEALDKRKNQKERSFDSFLKELKKDGTL